MATPVYGIEAFEYAPLGTDGALPTTGWKKITPIADDAVTLAVPAAATIDVRAQDISGVYVVLPGDTEPATFTVASLDLNGEQAAELIGGTWDATGKTYSAPAVDTINSFAVRLTSKPLKGKKIQFHIVEAAIFGDLNLSFVRNDLVRIGFTARSQTPLNSTGEPQSPWGWKEVTVG